MIRWSALAVLALHSLGRFIVAGPNLWLDLAIYNLIAIAILIGLFFSPKGNDPLAIAFLACAFGSWSCGSILSSYSQFFSLAGSFDYLINIAYTLFYPFVLLAIPRILHRRKKLSIIEILDAAIFGLGLSSIATALIFSQVISSDSNQTFFEIFYPICDLAIVITLAIASITQALNKRFLLLTFGFAIYLIFDYLYLWQSIQERYTFGTLFDNGWLLGFLLISYSLWLDRADRSDSVPIHPAFIALSIFISPSLLAMMALQPGIFPSYIIAPTIATLFLAFIRMTVSLRQASALGDEKALARTDELTGLSNRRQFIALLPQFSQGAGALMLLDLNGFKQVNDQYGHGVGDHMLIQVASRFAKVLPAGALLARLGGDEFGVLISGDISAIDEISQALKACVSYPFLIDGRSISIGVSVGYVSNSESGDLLAKADAAMYRAKRALNS